MSGFEGQGLELWAAAHPLLAADRPGHQHWSQGPQKENLQRQAGCSSQCPTGWSSLVAEDLSDVFCFGGTRLHLGSEQCMTWVLCRYEKL